MAFATELAKSISTAVDSQAILAKFGELPTNPQVLKQLEKVTKCLKEAIATDATFCYIDEGILEPTRVMLKTKGYDIPYPRLYLSSSSDLEQRGFYIDFIHNASAAARDKDEKEKDELMRKTQAFAEMMYKMDAKK